MYVARDSSRMRPNEMEMYGYQKILMMGHWFPGTTWGVRKMELSRFLSSEQWCDDVAPGHNERFARFFRALSANRYTKFYKDIAAPDVSFLEVSASRLLRSVHTVTFHFISFCESCSQFNIFNIHSPRPDRRLLSPSSQGLPPQRDFLPSARETAPGAQRVV